MRRWCESAAFIWVLAQALTITVLFSGGIRASVFLFLVLTVIGIVASNRGLGIIVHVASLVVAAYLMYVIEVFVGAARIATLPVLVCLFVGYAGVLLILRGCSFSKSRLVDCELPALVTAFCLTVRWPQKTALDFLGLLKFEDNAAWVGVATQMFRADADPVFSGPAISLLRTFMAPVAVTHFGETGNPQLSNSYVIVGLTFKILMFVAATVGGVAISRLAPTSSRVARSLLAVSGSAISYVLMGLPLSTGHLTFIGALAFLWSYLCVSDETGDSKVGHRFLQVATVAGFVGIWWPLLPVGVLWLALQTSLSSSVRQFSGLVLKRYRWLIVTVGIGAVLGVITVGLRMTDLLPLGFKEFFQVKGGLQPLPPNLLPFGFAGVVALAVWRFSQSRVENWVMLVISLGLYAFGLVLISQFVGPDYGLNYSPAKLLLLTAIFLSPFMFLVPAFILRSQNHLTAVGLFLCLAMAQGAYVVGWSLNSPRVTPAPRWGKTLLDTADEGNTVVFCQTSVPERRFEAYECSRHASALFDMSLEVGEAWRHLVLFPEAPSPESEARVKTLVDGLSDQINHRKKVVLLSLDEEFKIDAGDQWWIDRLPQWSRTALQS